MRLVGVAAPELLMVNALDVFTGLSTMTSYFTTRSIDSKFSAWALKFRDCPRCR
jgi:hypothetical protein